MKRITIFALLVSLAAFVVVSDQALAESDGKVAICHINAANVGPLDIALFPPTPTVCVTVDWGKVAEVSVNSLEAHIAHGDSVVFGPIGQNTLDALEEAGLPLPNGDCQILIDVVPLPGPCVQ